MQSCALRWSASLAGFCAAKLCGLTLIGHTFAAAAKSLLITSFPSNSLLVKFIAAICATKSKYQQVILRIVAGNNRSGLMQQARAQKAANGGNTRHDYSKAD